MIPPFLKSGDKVAFVSIARKVTKEEMIFAVETLQKWGLEVVFAPNLFNSHHQFAGTETERLSDLQWAFENTSIKAIFFARGGYGTSQIIDQIGFSHLLQFPKWLIGFSDITVLLNHLQQFDLECIHGVMPIVFSHENAQNSIESLKNLLWGKANEIRTKTHPFNRIGKASGKLVGGNLSLISNCIGTKSELDTNGKILFLEDLDEYLYHIDRMIGHLDRAGKFKNLAGLIIGHFSDMKDNPTPFGWSAYEIIQKYMAKYNFPVSYDFPVGHKFDNLSLICNRQSELIVDISEVHFFQ